MPLPVIVPVGIAAGLAAMILLGGNKKAKVSTAKPAPPKPAEKPIVQPGTQIPGTNVVFVPPPAKPEFKPSPPPEPPIVMVGKTAAEAAKAAQDFVTATGQGTTFQTDPSAKPTRQADGTILLPELTMIGVPPGQGLSTSGADGGKGKRSDKTYFKWAQNALNMVGGSKFAKLDPDGIWGNKSKERTKEYQKSKGLDPDGIVGRNTEAKLVDDGAPNPPWMG